MDLQTLIVLTRIQKALGDEYMALAAIELSATDPVIQHRARHKSNGAWVMMDRFSREFDAIYREQSGKHAEAVPAQSEESVV